MTILHRLLAVSILFSPASAQTIAENSAPFDGNGDRVMSLAEPADLARENDSPCGRDTLAILETEDGQARYVFCAFEDDTSGVLEVLAPGYESASILGSVQGRTSELLAALADDAPDYIASALDGGQRERTGEVFRTTIPTGRLQVFTGGPEVAASTSADQCAGNSAWLDEFLGNSEQFYVRELNCTNHHIWGGFQYCSLGTRRFHNSSGTSGWSQRTATASYSGGVCAAYGQVRSCGGNTNFVALSRPGTSGSWNTSLNYWVQNGWLATWYMYASDQRCRRGQDKDDFRYRSDSIDGAGHRFGYMFVRELTNTGGCVACTTD